MRSTQLKPDFAKGWFLVAKAMWKEGSRAAALKQIEARSVGACKETEKKT